MPSSSAMQSSSSSSEQCLGVLIQMISTLCQCRPPPQSWCTFFQVQSYLYCGRHLGSDCSFFLNMMGNTLTTQSKRGATGNVINSTVEFASTFINSHLPRILSVFISVPSDSFFTSLISSSHPTSYTFPLVVSAADCVAALVARKG